MNTDPKARDLFIVDNSISGWTGLRYLEEWASLAKAFDVATGFFEIGSLLALDGKWQQLDKIRILMGGEIVFRTRKLMLEAVKSRALAQLDVSIEADKDTNPFLRGVPAILAALKSGRSSAVFTTGTSFMRRPTSLTPSSKSSARRRSSDRATSLGPASRRTSS